MNRFIDTNIFIRYLVNDIPDKAVACKELFLSAERGEVNLVTSESVIAEIVFVLSSSNAGYGLNKGEVADILRLVLSIRGLHVPEREKLLIATELYVAHGIDFEDALTVVEMEKAGTREVYSYDKHFNRVPNIQRLEP